AANFMIEESRQNDNHLLDLVERNEIVCLGGFIGKTIDGLETTYERGGSDRTAADAAILLHGRYEMKVDFEKDSAVLSADPKIVKIVTSKKNCAIVRIESIAASHLIASLERDKQYHDFVKLSPYRHDDVEICRLLFLDADYVRKQERHFKAYYSKVEIVYGRGVVTLIGDMMWQMPNIASTASSTVGEHGINILNLDEQKDKSRILIIVEDKGTNVGDAVKAIHSKRTRASLK